MSNRESKKRKQSLSDDNNSNVSEIDQIIENKIDE